MKELPKNKQSFLALIRRFHLVLFTVVMTLILSVSVLLLYSVVNKASGEDSVPQGGLSTSFDQATIDEVNQLKSSDQPSEPLDFSGGRINPFGE